ncbi:MAG: N-6 DNA methylase [Ferruginibacter sp.]
MAPSTKEKTKATDSKTSFAAAMHVVAHRFPIFTVFDDFLTMTIASCTRNLQTGKSWYEEEYLQTIEKYKDPELWPEFPKAFASLINEMEIRVNAFDGNDVLGEFFEEHISNGRNGQYFTPYPICRFMASISQTDQIGDTDVGEGKTLRILDPACGSGRMLLASRDINGLGHEYYGIDIDRTCVKITALNLFLNGVWNSEVMCANALMPDDFVISYRISFLPLGIFKIETKEQSKLWQLHRNAFTKSPKERKGDAIVLDNTPFSERKKDDGTQLGLF